MVSISFTSSLAETILVSDFARLAGFLVFLQPSRSSLAFPTETPALWTNACAVAQVHYHKISGSSSLGVESAGDQRDVLPPTYPSLWTLQGLNGRDDSVVRAAAARVPGTFGDATGLRCVPCGPRRIRAELRSWTTVRRPGLDDKMALFIQEKSPRRSS